MLTSFFMTLKGIPFIAKCLITVFVGMLPIIEIRGAIPLGYVMGLNYWVAYLCSFIGNIIPIFFIVKYITNVILIVLTNLAAITNAN